MSNVLHVRQLAIACLQADGWTEFPGGPALATKMFDSAVGQKQAAVHLAEWSEEALNYTLQGDFQSEGRNAIEPHSILISKAASDDEIRRLTGQFIAGAENAISQTYAVRLLHSSSPEADEVEGVSADRPRNASA